MKLSNIVQSAIVALLSTAAIQAPLSEARVGITPFLLTCIFILGGICSTYLNSYLWNNNEDQMLKTKQLNVASFFIAIFLYNILRQVIDASCYKASLASFSFLFIFTTLRARYEFSITYWSIVFLFSLLVFGDPTHSNTTLAVMHGFVLCLALLNDPPQEAIQRHEKDAIQLHVEVLKTAGKYALVILPSCVLIQTYMLTNPISQAADNTTFENHSFQAPTWLIISSIFVALLTSGFLFKRWNKRRRKSPLIPDASVEEVIERPIVQEETPLAKNTPQERVIFAFNDMLERLNRVRAPHSPSDTPNEYCNILKRSLRSKEKIIKKINSLFHRALYSQETITEKDAIEMNKQTNDILEELKA